MQPIHLVIGLVEGIITASVLCFIYEARPEMLYGLHQGNEGKVRVSYQKTMLIFVCLFLIIGGGISLLASHNPDGLEWSIEKLTGSTELESKEETSYTMIAENIQESTAILPDYHFRNSETVIGTSVSGIIGCGITIAFLCMVGYIIKWRRKKDSINE